MPSAHRVALKKLLDVVEQKIAQADRRMLNAASDFEREMLVQTLADLHVHRGELMAALRGEVS
jgi:vacuolar-type H+-ATPase subunit B/Vma2